MDYSQLNREGQEKLLLPEIIRILRLLGGKATRHEIKQMMRKHTEFLEDEDIDELRQSTKSGKYYPPFLFVFNFALKNLKIAEYVIYERMSEVELTELGRKVTLDDEFYATIQRKAIDYWSRKRTQRQNDRNDSPQHSKDLGELENTEMTQEDWREQLKNALMNMSPQKFELFARALVKAMGVELDEELGVQYVADGGIDGFGYVTSDEFRTSRVAIQAKRWQGSVPSPEIDKFRGAMDAYNAEYGIFITTSQFSRPAIQSARKGTRAITLIDGDKITELVARYEVYARKIVTYELDSFYFEQD